jgi:hypothetical protein
MAAMCPPHSHGVAYGGEEQSFLRNLFKGVTKFTPFGT